ncbi:MAG: FkbM family methyltransferase [Candidatus Omnitrophica bacterium]|nr:FkbM family methyltransferase [Candidatus Omnitrophota bacterium]
MDNLFLKILKINNIRLKFFFLNLLKKIYYLNYEKVLFLNYSKFLQEGDVVIDIGAHTGLHSDNFIKIIGKKGELHCFEPLPEAFSQLKNKYSIYKNVFLHKLALSNFKGKKNFFYAKGLPEESGLKKRFYTMPGKENIKIIKVDVSKLDYFVKNFKKINYIKIDTEGAEIDIIKGGINLINKFKPIISIEYGFPTYSVYGYKRDNLYFLAKDIDYLICDLGGYVINSLEEWKKVVDKVYWDFYLIPKEKLNFFLTKIKK